MGCLQSARTSVLVNGSSTREFSMKKGLHQGDPLSAFLFIIVMEGLHLAFHKAMENIYLRGIKVRESNLRMSHFLYADDVIIMSEWSGQELDYIINILEVFHLVSGLKVNVSKSLIFGVGVADSMVTAFENSAGCRSASFAQGGLNIDSLKAFSLALSHKGRWQYLNTPDDFGVKSIKSIHGNVFENTLGNGYWTAIVDTRLKSISDPLIPLNIIHMEVGDERSISFWNDIWCGTSSLVSHYTRLYHLNSNKFNSIAEKRVNNEWQWIWVRDNIGVRIYKC
ncbi:uncharacterized protein [Rutidosis leptorrhynchoides]|uniref:uncharacterized protein n=1 Tax=Rutidosis leptorrhynchoides TaxID=125765 RepID=UPI003A99D9A3